MNTLKFEYNLQMKKFSIFYNEQINKLNKFYKDQMKKLSMFEKFLIYIAITILIIILIFMWFIHIRLTVMNAMKPEFKYRDYVVHEPTSI